MAVHPISLVKRLHSQFSEKHVTRKAVGGSIIGNAKQADDSRRTAIRPQPRRLGTGGIAFIMRDIWNARDLITQFVKRDLTIRYSEAIMGFAWAILMPLLVVGSGLIFRLIVSTLSGEPIGGDALASIAVKSIPWAFFSGAIAQSTAILVGHANLIGKVYFPRETLPLAAVIAQGVDIVVGGVSVVILLLFLGTHFGANAIWAPLIFALLFGFTFGISLLLSCANLFYRDVKYIVQVLLNFGIFATPVLFNPQLLGPRPAAAMLALPLSPYIQAIDICLVQNHTLLEPLRLATRKGDVLVWSPWYLLYATVMAVVLPMVGLIVFRRASARFAEVS